MLRAAQIQPFSASAAHFHHRPAPTFISAASQSRQSGSLAAPTTTPEALAEWLECHGTSTAAYGTGNAKRIEDLLHEIVNRECSLKLEDGRPVRRLSVINLFVRNRNEQVLIEERQVLPDGRERQRGLPLSEKMYADEDWRTAALRAVVEELGSALPPEPQVYLIEETHEEVVTASVSMSYPGLTSEYIRHRVEAQIAGLPVVPFRTEEQRSDGSVLTSFWAWHNMPPLGRANGGG